MTAQPPPYRPKRRTKGLALVHYTMDYRNLADKLAHPDTPLREWEFPCESEGAAKKMRTMIYGHWKSLREEGSADDRRIAAVLSSSYSAIQVGAFVRLLPKFDRRDAVALRAGMEQIDAIVAANREAWERENPVEVEPEPEPPPPQDIKSKDAEPCGTPREDAPATPLAAEPPAPLAPSHTPTAASLYGTESRIPTAPSLPPTPSPWELATEAQQMVRRLGGSARAALLEARRTLTAAGVPADAVDRAYPLADER